MIKSHHRADVSTQSDIEEVFKHHFQLVYQSSNPSVLDTEKGTTGVINRMNTTVNNTLKNPFT